MSKRGILLIIVLLLGAPIVREVFLYKAASERSKWHWSQRQRLIEIKDDLFAYMKAHDGAMPETREGLVTAGIVTREDLERSDPAVDMRVGLRYRPVPRNVSEPKLMLLVEWHERPLNEFRYVTADGTVWLEVNLQYAELIAADNKLRRDLGLDPIE